MATLKDISAKLGLSTATVSRALNGFDDVHPDTKAKIQDAARELGYVPNRAAKSLVSGKSNIICLIADLELVRQTRHNGSPDFLELVSKLSFELSERGYDLVFSVKPPHQNVILKYKDMIKRGIVDAFVVGAPMQNDARIDFLTDAKFPFVVHGLPADGCAVPFVTVDNAQIVRDPLHALLDLGHRRIAIIQDDATTTHAIHRSAVYRATLAAARQEVLTHLEFLEGGNASRLRSYVLGLFSERLGPAPTAIMCGSVPVAAELAVILEELGLTIPGDVSVVAHDDGGRIAHLPPGLPELCRTYFDWTDTSGPLADLTAAVSKAGTTPVQRHGISLPCELIFGQSIARPKAGPGEI
ncbi:LacI family DNA-binding transcriptional regulator [Actibacterium sp. 188UL27-1]|uniref:LacI family DNA-binding transcriptional regulator n=1 Tax=Actibacterium sp. 188UL27-1 TaxID=2786961 RepID=UPI00195A6954|nr:LacI family DNA-binding transcriptional regulator [Actibacterium sp. 188UL27-1]MBM7069167.1 LacI family DNA-binding transcriptional regulator [Actibacterium sp. 188UL27-1]